MGNNYPPTATTIEIRKGFADATDSSICGTAMRDEVYALPSLDWLVNEFAESFRKFQERMLLMPGYHIISNNCNHFMSDALYWASVLHRNTRQDAVLAFGECVYQPDEPGPRHALCVAACRVANGRIVPVVWEPQTRRTTGLSLTEWSTAEITFK